MSRILLAGAAALVLVGVGVPQVSAQPIPEPVYDGKPLSEWLKLLKSADARDRERAAEAIGAAVPQSRPGLNDLLAALGDQSITVRGAAGRALTSPAAVPALTAAL